MRNNPILEQLQQATLNYQGLNKARTFGSGKSAVLNAIEHLGYIQIDTLSVVERAHHHTLWTRIPDYKSEYLNELVEERKIFEYWFHAASYLPMSDFRFALPQMLYYKRGESRYYNNVDPKSLKHVYESIRTDGPKKARDFKSPKEKPGSWWNWKPAKLALEKLFMQGDLMICNRDGMEKVYDLTERVLPNSINTAEPTALELAEHLVKTHLRAYGITSVKQITHLRTGKELRKRVEEVLQMMLEENAIQEIKLEGLPTMFTRNGLLDEKFRKPTSTIKLLSPFDNSIIHRDRIKQLFDFDFRLECYVPKAKRIYGYFCLPILHGNTFIGRVDCKAHRKTGLFELIHLHIEERDIDQILDALVKAVQRFATFNGCQSIKLTKVNPPEYTDRIRSAIENCM